MIIYFIFSHDSIQKAVKQETSLLAERKTIDTQNGERSFFEELVMDEEYDILFRRLFLEAHAEIMKIIPPKFLNSTPTDLSSTFTEFQDFRQDRDFALWLNTKCDFTEQYKKSIGIKIQQFLVDYICWRWLETKSPQDAITYYSRLNKNLLLIKELLFRIIHPLRKKPSFP